MSISSPDLHAARQNAAEMTVAAKANDRRSQVQDCRRGRSAAIQVTGSHIVRRDGRRRARCGREAAAGMRACVLRAGSARVCVLGGGRREPSVDVLLPHRPAHAPQAVGDLRGAV